MTVEDRAGGPLAGLRVLSLAFQFPGPYATLLLADMGADVVLVEPPSGGDPTRQFPGFFESLNRNKRSIALNLKREGGRRAFLRMVEDADVLFEGFRPGTMARLGLGFDDLRGINPRLVYVSISGFGQDGPSRDRPAHDVSYQAMAGMLFDRLVDPAVALAPSVPVGDLSSGMFAALGALAAVSARERTGEGAYLDVAMTDGLVSWMTTHLVPVMNDSGPPGYPFDAGLGLYPCLDGQMITLSVAHEDWFWQRLCGVLHMDDLAELTSPERLARSDELADRIAEVLATGRRDDWAVAFAASDVPFGPLLALDEVIDSAQVRSRGLVVEVEDEVAGLRRHVRQPVQFSTHDCPIVRGCPTLGQHTAEVLRAHGLADDEIAAVLAEGR
jgi:crotonobetainyl-CoA:carnitine CoA-transferase CaiB-like acyl-CoA transferase